MLNSTEPDNLSSVSSTSEEEMAELEQFRSLKNDGYVYSKNRKKGEYTTRELLQEVLIKQGKRPQEIFKILDFSFQTSPDGGIFLTGIQMRVKKHYHKICKRMAVKYKKDNNRCAPRMKKQIGADDMVKGVTGMGNLYTKTNIKIITDYLNKYPFDTWGDKIVPEFPMVDGKYHCKHCDFESKWEISLKRHFTSKKHLKNIEMAKEKDTEVGV